MDGLGFVATTAPGECLDGVELMRLACPNCDARYEIPDDAIPEAGRDVQCSNCGHAWFQTRPATDAGADIPAPRAAAQEGPAPALSAPAPEAARNTIDNSVLSILREEADREAEARRAEARRSASRRAEAEEQFRTQPDLGIALPPAASAGGQRLKPLTGEDAETAAAKPAARRDLLPNVDDINSTLQPDSTDGEEEEDEAASELTRGTAFRIGFLIALSVLVAAAVVYLAAPAIQKTVPALETPLASYVGFVDGLRHRLDALMDSATDKLNGDGG